jgi:hypothetical protein
MTVPQAWSSTGFGMIGSFVNNDTFTIAQVMHQHQAVHWKQSIGKEIEGICREFFKALSRKLNEKAEVNQENL